MQNYEVKKKREKKNKDGYQLIVIGA